MAPRQAKPTLGKVGRRPSVSMDQGTRLQGTKKEQVQPSPRKSARLQHFRERATPTDTNTERKHRLPSPTSNAPSKMNPPAPLQDTNPKRKRPRESEAAPSLPPVEPLRKRQRTSLTGATVKDVYGIEAASAINDNKSDPIDYWRENGRWPEEFFKQDDQARKDFGKDFGKDFEKLEMNRCHLPTGNVSSSYFRDKQPKAGSSSATPSDQRPREGKSAPYTRPGYETVLAIKGSFMDECKEGIKKASRDLCQKLLHSEQTYPHNSLFRDDLFDKTCRKIRNRNEAMVIRDVSLLIVPSAQILATYGATHLDPLIESVNEGWNSAIPFYGPRPQPDYSVGFGRSAFTNDQLEKLKPFVGEITYTFASHFMATWQMYFPFLTCEVKCDAAALDVADRQNAHSMTLAVRGVVELFRLVKREKELHREILAFSISHDHNRVRIYGHYALINGRTTAFYRHPIREFSFTELGGKEKWTAYRFTRNIYDIWMPTHLKRICSVIDELPLGLEFEEESESGESGISRVLESRHRSCQSSHDASSMVNETDSRSNHVGSLEITPDTSLSQRMDGGGLFSITQLTGLLFVNRANPR